MPGFIDEVIESFKQTLNLPLWLYFLIVQLVEAAAVVVVLLFLLLIGFLALFGPIASVGGPDNIEALLSNPALLLPVVGIVCLLFFVFFVAAIFISSLFTGMNFHLFNDFLRTKRLDLSKAFEKARPRYFTFFKINLLVTAVIFIGLAIAFVPLLLSISSAGISAPNTGLLILGIGLSAILLLIVVISLFLLSPVLYLLAPTAFFENRGVVDSIKRALKLVKANYFANLAFFILYVVIVMVISFLVNLVLQFLQLALMLPAAAMSPTASPEIGSLFFLLFLISMLIYVPFTVWSVTFETACFRNLYFLDLGLVGPKGKPKRRPPRKRRKAR